MTRSCPFLENLHNLFGTKIRISIPCFGITDYNNFQKTIGKTKSIVFEPKIIICSGISDQFLYSVQEFRLNIDTPKTANAE